MIVETMEAVRVTEKRWRACVLYNVGKPESWIELSADTLEQLLSQLKDFPCAVRIIIYRRVNWNE
jgi:hypothetical protein